MTRHRSHIKPPKTIGELRRRLPGWKVTYSQQKPWTPTHGRYARRLSSTIRGRKIVMHVVRAIPSAYADALYWNGVPYTEARDRSKSSACIAVLLGARAMDMEEDL